MVPSAYLRLFQPLDSFEREEQLHWERYLVQRRQRTRPPRYADRVTGTGVGLLAPADVEHAEVRVVAGRTYLAPERMRLRVLESIVHARHEEPSELFEALVPKKEAARARRQLARHRRRDPHVTPFVQQSAWHVPIRWFVAFTDDERTLRDDEHGRLRLRYLTSSRRAVRRLENAIHVIRRSDLGPIAELLWDMRQWIVRADQRSILELDYGELCDSMSWNELDDDRSAGDIADAIAALEKFERAHAADVYQHLLLRWTEIRRREDLN